MEIDNCTNEQPSGKDSLLPGAQSLYDALLEGEQSGFVEDFNPQEHLEEIKAKYLQ